MKTQQLLLAIALIAIAIERITPLPILLRVPIVFIAFGCATIALVGVIRSLKKDKQDG